MTVQTKVVGASGQISLGKQYAGQHIMIEEIEPGEWRIRAAITIPRNQAWVHTKDMQAQLTGAREWIDKTPPKETNLASLAKKLGVARGRSK